MRTSRSGGHLGQRWTGALPLCCVLVLSCAAAMAAEPYTFQWWAHGYRGASPEGRRVVHVQTNMYGAAFDVERADITRLGLIAAPLPYAEAAAQSNEVVSGLPASSLRMSVTVQGRRYVCVRAARLTSDEANYPVRLIDGGRWLHRFDLLGLEFETAEGDRLNAWGRLEISAWPERMHLSLSLTPEHDLLDAVVLLELGNGEGQWQAELSQDFLAAAGEQASVRLAWPPDDTVRDAARVQVRDAAGENAALPVSYDAARGGYWVTLTARQWDMATNLDRLDRFPIRIENTGTTPETYPLVFNMEGAFQGVTGLCPVLRDAAGNPSGIPVQISKNWHRRPERRLLYEGAWFHGVTQVSLAPGAVWEGELAIAYARWGGVPAASHAQLSLIGWGGNQRWDQAAIGSFGESICYDPDVGLNRSMIDDVRPLMVRGMNDGKWEWTHNVGGGDFLLYVDGGGNRQYLSRVRSAYLCQGPNLTDVVYAGETPDGKVAVRVEVMTPRGDDLNRAYHRIRYDVRETTPFSRMAFYQLGADGYNDHQFTTLARGNAAGLVEEWETERGGKRYLREAMPCPGDAPWFALLGGQRSPQLEKGAWADRALVIRAWKARLGEQEIAEPVVSVYGTENGVPSANVELTPPLGLKQLEAGDYVEAEVELLVLPQRAEDYYGPNAAFRSLLEKDGGSWRVVHELARLNELQINAEAGVLESRLPIVVSVDETQSARLTMRGGLGFVPITFKGVRVPRSPVLEVNGTALRQGMHGNDYWQTQLVPANGTYAITYNIPFNGDDNECVIRFQATAE